MDWQGKYLQELAANRVQFAHLERPYEAFLIASERAALLDQVDRPNDLQASQLLPGPDTPGLPGAVAALAAKDDVIAAQSKRLVKLDAEITEATRTLLAAQQKIRNMAEEDQLRAKFVQNLQEEVISLNLQMTLADEARQKQLETIGRRLDELLEQHGMSPLQAEVAELLNTANVNHTAPSDRELERLESLLATANAQIESQQRRIKNMLEEQQLKSKVVQDLNDEILSLTLELNLSRS